jgi:hypothetical protein
MHNLFLDGGGGSAVAADCNNHIIHPSTDTGNTHLPPLKARFLTKSIVFALDGLGAV